MAVANTAITTRKVLVDGRAFPKSDTGPEAAALAFTEVSYEPFGPELRDEAFTAFGRIGPSLDRREERRSYGRHIGGIAERQRCEGAMA